jgi:hypothetical protein
LRGLKDVAESGCQQIQPKSKIMNTPLLTAYIAKQRELAKRLPDSVQTLFHGVAQDIEAGKPVAGSTFAALRLSKTPNLVEHLGMALDEARAINAADMAEYQAASAEYAAATA